jgi:hypothetical protein
MMGKYLYSEAFMVVSAGRILSFFEEEKVPAEFIRRRDYFKFEGKEGEYHRYSFRIPEEWGEYVVSKLAMRLTMNSLSLKGSTWIDLDQMKEIVYTYEVLDS